MAITENIRKFRIADFAIIIFISLVYTGLNYLLLPTAIDYSYIVSLALFIFFASLTAYLFDKFGSVFLFALISALIGFKFESMQINGVNKLILFLVFGAVFEIIYLFFRFGLKGLRIDVVIASAISASLLPLALCFMFSTNSISGKISAVLNLMLSSFLVAIVSSVVSFLIWSIIQNKKFALKMRYGR